MTRSRRLMIISGVAALATVGLLWLLFAPSQLGGSVDYVIIRGVSMEPRLQSGDLAVLHRQDTYAVGDVVGYESGLLHQFVLHRIVAKRGDHFLFKGDHNTFVDSYFPTKHEVAGRLWFDIPHGGVPVQWLHVPTHAGLLGGVVALLVLGGAGAAEAGRRRRKHRGTDGSERFAPSPPGRLPALGNDLWLIGIPAIAALGFGFLAATALTHSKTHLVSDPTAYSQEGAYSYTSIVPASSVYPSGVVRSTDPIYTNLVERLRFAIHYRLSSALPHSVDGEISLQARLRNADGWRSLVATAPAKRFNGDIATAALSLDTKRLYRQVRAFARDTGITNDSFTLDVVPRVSLHGTMAGRSLSKPAALAPLTFTVNAQSLAIAQQRSISASATAQTANPFTVEQPGTLQVPVPATLALLRLRVGVDRAEKVGIAGAGVALLVAFASLYLVFKRRRADELARILRRYGAWIIPVDSPLAGPKVVDVSSMESLVRLAEHYERAILHEEHERVHIFALEEDGTLFRYRLGAGELQPLRVEQPMPAEERVPVIMRSRGSFRR